MLERQQALASAKLGSATRQRTPWQNRVASMMSGFSHSNCSTVNPGCRRAIPPPAGPRSSRGPTSHAARRSRDEASRLAAALDAAAYELAAVWFASQGKGPRPTVADLESRFPGFSRDDYAEAVNNYILWARK